MESLEYNEDLIIESGLNMQLSPSIYLIDLMRIEYLQELRLEFAVNYIKEITKNSQYSFYENLSEIKNNAIILLGN